MAKPTVTSSSGTPKKEIKVKKGNPPAVKYWLIAYDTISSALWGLILLRLLQHIILPSSIAPPVYTSTSPTSTWNYLTSLFTSTTSSSSGRSLVHPSLEPYVARLSGSYPVVGTLVKYTQTLALFEILHAALGWARSPVATTAAQVASRLWTVWGVIELFPKETQSNPLYSIMILAWSITEIIRYGYYALYLMGIEPPLVLWLRYSTFLILYPVGASSEAFLSFATLPPLANLPVIGSYLAGLMKTLGISYSGGRNKLGFVVGKSWTVFDIGRLVLFIGWWPALNFLYSYMLSQRRKVLGRGHKVGGAKKAQ